MRSCFPVSVLLRDITPFSTVESQLSEIARSCVRIFSRRLSSTRKRGVLLLSLFCCSFTVSFDVGGVHVFQGGAHVYLRYFLVLRFPALGASSRWLQVTFLSLLLAGHHVEFLPPVQPELVPPVSFKWSSFHRCWRGVTWSSFHRRSRNFPRRYYLKDLFSAVL